MLRTFLELAFGLIALVGPALCANVQEEVRRVVALNRDGGFELANVNGAIEIRGWDRAEVDIRATKSGRDQAALDAIEVEIEAAPDQVRVTTHLPSGWGKKGSVAYEVFVPRSARILANTVNGRLSIDGAGAPVAAKSVNGAVHVASDSGPVRVETVNGSAEVRYAAQPADGEHFFKTVNGAVEVVFPGSVGGAFSAKSVNGAIETDFPLTVNKARFGPGRSLKGRLGAGDARFTFETVNGAIRLRSGENVASNVRYKLPK